MSFKHLHDACGGPEPEFIKIKRLEAERDALAQRVEELEHQLRQKDPSVKDGIIDMLEAKLQQKDAQIAEAQKRIEELEWQSDKDDKQIAYYASTASAVIQMAQQKDALLTQANASIASLQASETGLRAALEDIVRQCLSDFVRCESCGEQEDLVGCYIQHTAEQALSQPSPNTAVYQAALGACEAYSEYLQSDKEEQAYNRFARKFEKFQAACAGGE